MGDHRRSDVPAYREPLFREVGIGQLADRIGWSARNQGFHAEIMVQMNLGGRQRQHVMIVLDAHQSQRRCPVVVVIHVAQ